MAGSQSAAATAGGDWQPQKPCLFRRLGKPAWRNSRGSQWLGKSHRSSFVAKSTRIFAEWNWKVDKVDDSQARPESTARAQRKHRNVSFFCDKRWFWVKNLKSNRCENMQELILTENFLVELPNSIGRMVRLNNLNVDRNALISIPAEIGYCTNLGVLSLRDNKLTKLPSQLGNCVSLHVLDVSGNRLQYLPYSLVNLQLKAVWLSENQAQPLLTFQPDNDEETGEQVSWKLMKFLWNCVNKCGFRFWRASFCRNKKCSQSVLVSCQRIFSRIFASFSYTKTLFTLVNHNKLQRGREKAQWFW